MSIKEYAKRKLREYSKSEAERRAYRKILKKKAQQARRQAYAKAYVAEERKRAAAKARQKRPGFFSGWEQMGNIGAVQGTDAGFGNLDPFGSAAPRRQRTRRVKRRTARRTPRKKGKTITIRI